MAMWQRVVHIPGKTLRWTFQLLRPFWRIRLQWVFNLIVSVFHFVNSKLFCYTDCTDDQLKCGNETSCIDKIKRCDGNIDCWDGLDEKNCTIRNYEIFGLCKHVFLTPYWSSACPEGQFTCTNGECVSQTRFCDGFTDCKDGTDEPAGCGGSCRSTEKRCK